MVVILMLFWDVWSLASLIQDLGVVDEKGAERTKIDDCSCPKYVPLHLVHNVPLGVKF